MSKLFKSSLIVMGLVWLGLAHAAEQPRIFNLQEIEVRAVLVAGTHVRLAVTGQPIQILMFTNLAPSPLKHAAEPDRRRVQVTYGNDLVGYARVLVSSPNPKAAITSVSLMFETEEQAAAVRKVIGLRNATRSPLRKPKDGE